MIVAVLIALAGVALALAAHPFTTYPLSLGLLRRLAAPQPARPAPGVTTEPRFSLLVPAHNEERVIRDKIRNLQALMDRAPGRAEALVYVDGSSDRTAALLEAAGDPRIRVVVAPARTGKTAGLNRLVELASGDILVLSDANVWVEPDALSKLALRFGDPRVGLVCGHLRYVNGNVNATTHNGASYWQIEEMIRQLESDTGGAVGADGSLYAVRRSLWPVVPEDLIDDFYVPMAVRCRGHGVIRAGEIMAHERTAEDGLDEFRRKVRIACQAFNVHRRLWPVIRRMPLLDRYKYVSHKLLKWLIGFNLLIAGACTVLALTVAFGFGLALGATLLTMSGLIAGIALRVPPLPVVWDALNMLTAVALGVIRSLQGERFVTWQPAGSVRAGSLPTMAPSTHRAG